VIRTAILSLALLPALAAAEDVLDLDAFLSQAREASPALAASAATVEGIPLKAREAEMIYSPLFTANLGLYDDREEPTSAMSPERTRVKSWELGLSKKWFTGTNTTIGYGMNSTELFLPSGIPAMYKAFFPPTLSYTAKPSVSVSQSLLRDFMSGLTDSGLDKIRNAASGQEKLERYKANSVVFQAEQAYWALALARSTVKSKLESLERTGKMRDWTKRRADMNLSDRADLLQMEAAVKLRELDLKMAREEEVTAAQKFNTTRGLDGPSVPERLEDISARIGDGKVAVSKERDRLDVRATADFLESARHADRETFYRSLPELSAFGKAVFNGYELTATDAHDKAVDGKWPTYTAGIALIAPLDFWKLASVRRGYKSDYRGAKAGYEKARLEEAQDWDGLSRKAGDVATRLALAREIVSLQEERLANENRRYKAGRIVTSQLLTAEEDYEQARLTVLRLGFEKLLVEAQGRFYNAE
jgi:outer membrane protein TolC